MSSRMNLAAGTPTPGTSINFDAQALHDAEEAEYQQEEQERQNELRQLLTSAFDDDLSDEESVMSQDNDVSRLSHDQGVPTIHKEPVDEWAALATWPQNMFVQTSTPAMTGPAPPLQTPAIRQYMLGYYGNMVAPNSMVPFQMPVADESSKYSHQPQNGVGTMTLGYNPGDWAQNFHQSPDITATVDSTERGEIEGANDEDILYAHEQMPASYSAATPHENTGGYYGCGQFETVAGQQFGACADNVATPVQGNSVQLQSDFAAPTEKTPPQYYWSPNGHQAVAEAEYQVKYAGGKAVEKTSNVDHQSGRTVEKPREPQTQDAAGGSSTGDITTTSHEDQLQRKFLEQDGSTDSRQLAQLHMLYDARGHRLEELTVELKRVTDDGDREIRILNHKLSLKQDERDGMATSLEHTKQLLSEMKQRDSEVVGKVSSLEKQLQSLSATNEELKAKLQTAESTIESLTVQLMSLGESDTLTHTREQHSAFVSGLHQKHETEILRLNEMLDISKRALNEKEEEVVYLKRQVTDLLKASEVAQLDRADTINRLTHSVEESQRQCQQLLEGGNSHDVSRVRLQLQEAMAGKSIAEDLNSTLQAEIKELKEQIQMYESASQFLSGGTSFPTPPHFDDSYMQLGIKSVPQLNSPASRSATPSLSTEQTLTSLKQELERCLGMYRGKREQVTQLTSNLQNTKVQLGAAMEKMEDLRRELTQVKESQNTGDQFKNDSSDQKHQGALDTMTKQNEALTKQLQETISELEAMREREARMSEQQQELSHQMASMVHEYDEDKKEALERCQKTIMQHHEHTKQRLREELQAQFAAEINQQATAYSEEMEQLRAAFEAVQTEMLEVKQLYVEMCQQKDQLDADLKAQVSRHDQLIQEARSQWERETEGEREQAVKEARKHWEVQLKEVVTGRLNEARQLWQTENDEKLEDKLKSKLSSEREKWRSSELQEALAAEKQHWLQEQERQLREELSKEKEIWSSTVLSDTVAKEKEIWKNTEFKELLAKEKEVWLQTEVKGVLAREKEVWVTSELPAAVERARQSWQEDVLRTALQDAREMWEKEQLGQAVEAAREQWRETELKEAINCLEMRHNTLLQTTVKHQQAAQAGADVEQRVKALMDSIASLKQEVETERREKAALEKELSSQLMQWKEKRHQLIQMKDVERQKAIEEVRDEGKREYQQFVTDHSDTLSSALRAARQEFSHEKASLIKSHETELERLRETLSHSVQQNKLWHQEKTELEQYWQEQLEVTTRQHCVEKETLQQTYRENLAKALDDARARWNDKDTSATNQQVAALLLKEQQWETERAEFLGELRQRDELLENADSHLEAEVAKLHSQLNEQHWETVREEREKLRAQLNDSYSQHVQSLSDDNHELQAQLSAVSSRLTDLESSHNALVASLTAKLHAAEKNLRAYEGSLKEKTLSLDGCMGKRETDRLKLGEVEAQLECVRRQRQEAMEEHKRKNKELAIAIETHTQRQGTLTEKVRKLERCIKYMDSKSKKALAATTVSLEREHTEAIEKMMAKMEEMRESHAAALEALKTEYTEEKKRLSDELDAVISQQKRQMAHTPTQTDNELVELTALQTLHQQYLEAVSKIREDVLKHVCDSSERTATRLKCEMVKEREMTAKRLRRHYINSLSQLLEKEYDCTSKQQKLAFIEHSLNNLPLGSSTNTTPMTSVDNTPETTPRDMRTVSVRSRGKSGSHPSILRDEQCVTPDDLDSDRHRDLHYRTPDNFDSVRSRELHSRTLDDVDAVIRRELHPRTDGDLDYVRHKDMNSRTPDNLDSEIQRQLHSRTPDDLDYGTCKDRNSRTPDDLDSVRRREKNSRTPDDLDYGTCKDRNSRTPDDLDSVRRREKNSQTPDDLDSIRYRNKNSQTPNDLNSVRRRDVHSRTPDDLDSVRHTGTNLRTPDDLDSARGRHRLCQTDTSVKRVSRRSVTPDDLDSDYTHRVHPSTRHKYVESETSRMQRTKSLSSLLHTSIASWELANRAILQPEGEGEGTVSSNRLYFQSGVNLPSGQTNVHHDNTRATDKTVSREEGHSSIRGWLATDVVSKLKSRDDAHARTSLRDSLSTGLSRKAPVSGSTYRYTSLRKTTNLAQSAGTLSMRSKSVPHLLEDTDARLSSKTLFQNLDDKPRQYNPPAERLDSVASRGHTTKLVSVSPDLVRHTTPAATTGRSERHVTSQIKQQSGTTGNYQQHSFLPVEGAAHPSRHDTLLCHPMAMSSHHSSGDTSNRSFKPMTGRHTHAQVVPPVKLYHIDNM